MRIHDPRFPNLALSLMAAADFTLRDAFLVESWPTRNDICGSTLSSVRPTRAQETPTLVFTRLQRALGMHRALANGGAWCGWENATIMSFQDNSQRSASGTIHNPRCGQVPLNFFSVFWKTQKHISICFQLWACFSSSRIDWRGPTVLGFELLEFQCAPN